MRRPDGPTLTVLLAVVGIIALTVFAALQGCTGGAQARAEAASWKARAEAAEAKYQAAIQAGDAGVLLARIKTDMGLAELRLRLVGEGGRKEQP